ncbi:MAG: hypothetical protein LQ351_004411 [Letrouitia transgressa]|nr:MAG: hypothetical protein LQ351_004411 [Letrouitia transgressa]
MAEFSDMQLKLPPEEETYHNIFEAKHITTYLNDYVNRPIFNDRSLRDRIIFGFTAKNVERYEDSWQVRGIHASDKRQRVIQCSKLMIAAGLTTEPKMPDLPEQESYQGMLLHQRDFGHRQALSERANRITVLGAGKSAADMVYQCAKSGKEVTWVIRKSGTGPAAFIDIKGHGRYKNASEIGHTRMMLPMMPSCFTSPTLLSRFVQNTKLGQAIDRKIWDNADRDIRQEANYHQRYGARKGYPHLFPETAAFWCNGPVGLLQHPDFWEIISQKVDVHRCDISHLTHDSVVLSDGTGIVSDAILCGTGWKQPYAFFSDELHCQLGLPHPSTCHCLEDNASWMTLHSAAKEEILSEFPALCYPPTPKYSPQKTSATEKTPYRLYNLIAPLNDFPPSIVFLGQIRMANSFRTAECQALWASAYLDGTLPLPSYDEMEAEIAYTIAFSQCRYPISGGAGNYFFYDVISYTDKLLAELGLRSHKKVARKHVSGHLGAASRRVRNFFDPCFASDLEGVVEEYKSVVEKGPFKPLRRSSTRQSTLSRASTFASVKTSQSVKKTFKR